MINSTIFGILIFILTLVPGLLFAENVIDDSKNPQYLFTLASKSGTFKGDTLTLKGIPLVVYFSDRPYRTSGHLSLEDFVKLWDKGVNNFKNDPPNAELSIYKESGDKHAVVIIKKPKVKDDNVTFNVVVIDETIHESFGHTTLFIDGLGMIFPTNQN